MNSPTFKSNRLVIVVILGLCALCLALGVFVFRSQREVARLSNDHASLKRQLEVATHEAAQKPADSAADEQPPVVDETATRAQDSTATTSSPSAVSETDESPERRRRIAEDAAAMMRSPMMQQIMASQTAAAIQMTYRHLARQLEFAPEESDHFFKLLANKQTNIQNLGIQLMNPGLTDDQRTQTMQQLTAAWQDGEAKIREFLNDDADYAAYQKYSQQEPERREVGMFEDSLPDNESIDAATADALATLQNEARKQFPFTVDFYDPQNFGNPAVLNTTSVERFLEEQKQFQADIAQKAVGLLTPAHLEVFKQNQAAVRQMSTMQLNNIVQLAGGRQ